MTLESVFTDLNKILVIAGPHWPFFVYTGMFAFVGEVMKRQVLTPANEAKLEKEASRWWNRKGVGYFVAVCILTTTRIPLPLHPMIAGFFLGFIPGIPLSAGVHYGAQSVLYCMGAGIASNSLYAVIRAGFKFWWTNIARKTEPVPDLVLPGDPSNSLPPPPSDAP